MAHSILFTFETSFLTTTLTRINSNNVSARLSTIQMALSRLEQGRACTASSTSAMVCGSGIFFVSGNRRLVMPPKVRITPLIISGILLVP